MPTPIIPHKSPAHQFACRALYRALLRQIVRLPEETHSDSLREGIGHHVLRRFKKDSQLDSPYQITNALKVGYEALDLLRRSSNGSMDATTRIESILHSYKPKHEDLSRHKKYLQQVAERLASRIPRTRPKYPESLVSPIEKPRNVLEDPVPISELKHPPSDGLRRVPTFVIVQNGITFLRYHKPQPKRLTQMIRGRLRTHNRIVSEREKLRPTLLWAKDEDLWDDNLVEQIPSARTLGIKEPELWADDIIAADKTLSARNREWGLRNLEIGRRMMKVWLKEKALGDIEGSTEEWKRKQEDRRRIKRKLKEEIKIRKLKRYRFAARMADLEDTSDPQNSSKPEKTIEPSRPE